MIQIPIISISYRIQEDILFQYVFFLFVCFKNHVNQRGSQHFCYPLRIPLFNRGGLRWIWPNHLGASLAGTQKFRTAALSSAGAVWLKKKKVFSARSSFWAPVGDALRRCWTSQLNVMYGTYSSPICNEGFFFFHFLSFLV